MTEDQKEDDSWIQQRKNLSKELQHVTANMAGNSVENECFDKLSRMTTYPLDAGS